MRKLFEKEAKDEKDISDFGGTVRACPAFAEFDDDIFISVGEFSLYFG